MTITKEAVIQLIGDRPVAYHPILARVLGGVIEAVFVSQLLYWYDKGKLADNWIFKTMVEWEKETGLTRRNQETARKNLLKSGVIEYQVKGVPGKGHYRLNIDRLVELLSLHGSDNVQTEQSRQAEPSNLDSTNPPNLDGGTSQSIPETTTETTPENTTERGAAEKTPPAPAPSRDYLTDLFNGNTQDDGLREGEKLIQIADWDIRSPEHRQAMAAFLEASRLPVPPDKTRKDWIKSIDTHVQTYGATELENMYPCIIAQMRGDNLTVSRPGSVTNNLADYWAKERNGGNNARSSERHTEHQKRIAEAFRSTARNPGD